VFGSIGAVIVVALLPCILRLNALALFTFSGLASVLSSAFINRVYSGFTTLNSIIFRLLGR
jgi:hypothetical protein